MPNAEQESERNHRHQDKTSVLGLLFFFLSVTAGLPLLRGLRRFWYVDAVISIFFMSFELNDFAFSSRRFENVADAST